MAIATALTACIHHKNTDIIGKNDLKIENGRMTPEALWALGRLGDIQVSPGGTQLLYGVTYYSVAKSKSNREIFVINTDASNARQITHSTKSDMLPNG